MNNIISSPKRTLLICALLPAALCLFSAPAQSAVIGDLLQSVPDARARAMGNAATGLADDIFGLFFNPAGLAQLDGVETGFAVERSAGNNTALFGGLTYDLRDVKSDSLESLGTIAAGMFTFTADDPAAIPPAAEGLHHGDRYTVIGYGRALTDDEMIGRLMAGLSCKLYRFDLPGERAEGQSFDFGMLWKYPGKNLRAGVAYQNYGSRTAYAGSEYDLPAALRLGVSAGMLVNTIVLAADLVNPAAGGVYGNAGVEVRYPQALVLRAGYDGVPGTGGLNLGVGLELREVDAFFVYVREVTAGYAFLRRGSGNTTHQVSVALKFGAE